MIAAIAESLTFNPTDMVFALNMEHRIFGGTSPPHNSSIWKIFLEFFSCENIGGFTFIILDKTGSVSKPFLAQLKLWPVLLRITLHVVSGAPGATYKSFLLEKYPIFCVYFRFFLNIQCLCVYFSAINSELRKRIPICLIEASFPGKN